MAKALLGTSAHPSQLRLLNEIRALRQRVAELEEALETANRAAADRADLQVLVNEAADQEPVNA